MSKVYETLKKKNDTSVEVYPNIERTNIPDGAINTAKIEDRAVTYNKLSDALQDDITHFRNIYDADDDKISASDIDLSDDVRCSNVYASNSVYATDSVEADNVSANTYYDADDDELKAIFNHSLSFTLRERNDVNEYQFRIHITSSIKTPITTFSELITELSKKIWSPIYDYGYDIMGVITAVNTTDSYISMYCNSPLVEYDFDTLITINDDVYPI